MRSVSDVSRWRTLVALLVYNGEAFVPKCLDSLSRLDTDDGDVDVVILDDSSPEPGWSGRLEGLCGKARFGYYRSPRNLGIPRNMNLGMLRAVEAGYDAVILLNSDTVVPSNLVPSLIRPLRHEQDISSVTAWSNAVSVYSLPMEEPNRLADAPGFLDWMSDRMTEEFAGQVIDIPSAMGFCMAIPTRAITAVGLMDPVFGRGYSEEIDWALRSHVRGFRSVLSPSCLVYHFGSGSTVAEGMVDAHQAIVDRRYPLYRSQVAAFLASSIPDSLIHRGLTRVIVTAAREFGYRIDAARVAQLRGDAHAVSFAVTPQRGTVVLEAAFRGIRVSFPIGDAGALRTVEAIVGRPPLEVRMYGKEHPGELTEAPRRETAPFSPAHHEHVF